MTGTEAEVTHWLETRGGCYRRRVEVTRREPSFQFPRDVTTVTLPDALSLPSPPHHGGVCNLGQLRAPRARTGWRQRRASAAAASRDSGKGSALYARPSLPSSARACGSWRGGWGFRAGARGPDPLPRGRTRCLENFHRGRALGGRSRAVGGSVSTGDGAGGAPPQAPLQLPPPPRHWLPGLSVGRGLRPAVCSRAGDGLGRGG